MVMNDMAAKTEIDQKDFLYYHLQRSRENAWHKILVARILGLNFNIHNTSHLFRAAQEGIVFSIRFGFDIMRKQA